MGNVALFSGQFAKFLKDKLNLFDKAYILTGNDDPRVVATSAPKGSILMRQGPAGQVFVKLDDGLTTNWQEIPLLDLLDINPEPASGFRAVFLDKFDLEPDDAESLIRDTETTATYNPTLRLYNLLCDKSKLVTVTGTSYTVNSAPTFTLAPGDIIYYNGNFRRIASVSTATTGTLDAAFPADFGPAPAMLSQAVWTKDLINNIGDAAQTTRPRDFFPGEELLQVHLEYFDSLASGDTVPDFIDEARLVAAACNEGLYTDVDFPTSDNFTQPFTRPKAPDQIPNLPLLDLADKERLFLVFFCNPDNASVTSEANLLRYKVSFYEDETLSSGGALDSSFAMSDASGTPIRCDQPYNENGRTRLRMHWNHVVGVNPGETSADIDVLVDGKVIPREVAGSTQDAWWRTVPGTTDTIEFWDDLTVTQLSIEIRRRQGVIDSSEDNTANLNLMFSPQLLSAGPVTLVRKPYQRILTDSSGGPFTINLPASPQVGDRVFIQDAVGAWFSNNVTIGRNGNNIEGVASDDFLDVNNAWIEYEFYGGSRGWIVRT